MTQPTVDQASFTAADDTDLFYQSWTVPEPKALMVIAHGMGEHSGRYGNVLDVVLPLGFAVFALDHRGHGKSGGRRGHVMAFSEYTDDLKAFVDLAKARVPGVPVVLLGHSMGGLIALAYALAYPGSIDYLVISSPALGVGAPIPKIKEAVGRKLSLLWPTLAMSSGLDATAISRDSKVVRVYQDDPLVHDRVTARFFTELTGQMDHTVARAGELAVPLLLQIAGSDRLVAPDVSEAFFENVGTTDKTFHRYEKYFHEIYNDLEKEVPLADLAGWLTARVAGEGAAGS